MIIVLATDNNFVQHCCVAMTSVLMHNSGVHFYIFTEELLYKNTLILKNQAAKYDGRLDIIKVDSRVVSNFPMPSNADAHISIATYYRLFAALILPEDIEKIIYMDCDMIARNSFKSLWDTNIEGYALGAVYQPLTDSQTNDKRRLLIPNEMGYFNAGLLLMNLKYWRENDVTDRLMNFIKTHFDLIKQHDQDVLNAVLHNEVKPLSYTWNFIEPYIDISKLRFQPFLHYDIKITDPSNIHFVSAPKPWDYGCSNPFRDEYYRYIKLTPFKDFKPKFIWKKYYHDVLRHKLIKIIITLDLFELRKMIKH